MAYSYAKQRLEIRRALRAQELDLEALETLAEKTASREPRYLARIEASWALREVVRFARDESFCLAAARLLVQSYGASGDARFEGDTLSPVQVAIVREMYDLAAYLRERGAKPDKPMFVVLEGKAKRVRSHKKYAERLVEFERRFPSSSSKKIGE